MIKPPTFALALAIALLGASATLADVSVMQTLPAQSASGHTLRTAMTSLRDLAGYRAVSLSAAPSGDWLIQIRFSDIAKLDQAISTLSPDLRMSFVGAERFELVAEDRRWPGPPWRRANRGWAQ